MENKLKTMTINVKDKKIKKILEYMAKISKNIYNSTIYNINIFNKYHQKIFKKIASREIKNEISVEMTDEEKINFKKSIEDQFYDEFDKIYIEYNKSRENELNNNKIIYQFINTVCKNIYIINSNFEIIRHTVIFNLLKNKDIKYDLCNTQTTVIDYIDYILRSMYNKSYYLTENEIKNNKPVTIKNEKFIRQVKEGKYILPKIEKVNWKKQIENHFDIKLGSNNNLIGRVTYRHLNDNKDKLPSDIIINIMQKAYEGYKSYFSLLEKGLKPSCPKYLPKDGRYILPFFANSFKIETDNVRLTVGKYVSKNYKEIINDKNLICLNDVEETEYKKYVENSYMKNGKGKKTTDYIIDKKYINKKDDHIINSYYINFKLPPKIKNCKIKNLEIIPVYDGFNYKLCIRYEKEVAITNVNDIKTIDSKESISVDLGICNLMTIYDPDGIQHIISGKYIVWLNNSINHKIDKLKSICNKQNNVQISNQIRNLLIYRSNLITEHFNSIVNLIYETYKHKKLIIVGYNTNWKNRVNLGKKNNRTFYNIPYSTLLNILKTKFMDNGILYVSTEESYTSKCDALSLEPVCKHDNYSGKRIKRGLFSSSANKLINADLNGAINIMRKYYTKNGIKFNSITGKNLYNPVILKLPTKLFHKTSRQKANDPAIY